MKFNVICIDIPWTFSDKLKMSDVKRGAESQYSVLNQEKLKTLPVQDVSADDSLLCLWVPSSLLAEGLELMNVWGFRQTQTFIWVKTKKSPLESIVKKISSNLDEWFKDMTKPLNLSDLYKIITDFNLNDILGFNMGRLFRNCHEICLVGVKGKIYDKLKNKSQRTVCLDVNTKHSAKTEILQDRLDIMFPEELKLEMFARRIRQGWTCVGNEVDGIGSKGEDIFDSIQRLKNLPA